MAGLAFLIMFLVLIILIAVVPHILKKFHIPGVISIMLVGIAIGPNNLNLIGELSVYFGRGYAPEQLYSAVDAMGLLGLVFLMSLAGMEVDLAILRAEKKSIFWMSLFTILLPAITGYLVYAYFKAGDNIGKLLYASLFASHSIGIVFPVMRELNAVKTRFGVTLLAATVISDIASFIMLAFCVQMRRHSSPVKLGTSISIFDNIDIAKLGDWLFFTVFLVTIMFYIVISIWSIPKIGRWIFKKLSPSDDSMLTFFLAIVLVVVFFGEVIGINIIVAAYIAGMALVRVKKLHGDDKILQKKLEGAGYGIMIPFLFLSIGMKTNIGILFNSSENAMIVILTVGGLVVSKLLSGLIAYKISGFSFLKSFSAGLMTVPQLSATLAAAAVGMELGIIDTRFFNAVIVLSIVTTLPAPVLVKYLIYKFNIRFDGPDEKLSIPVKEKPIEETLI